MIAGLNRIFIFTICSKINHPPFITFITLNLTIYFQSKTADSGRWIKGRDLMALSSYSNDERLIQVEPQPPTTTLTDEEEILV